MNVIGYYIFYLLNWVTTLLPLRILYILSDILYLILFYFPSYRRKVVYNNLKNSFPEKTDTEIKVIEKKFYKHLADLFIETFKIPNLSEKEHKKRCTVSNQEILDKLFQEKRDVIAVMGHYCNWEWLTILPLYTNYKMLAISKPLRNKYFNSFINKIRSKYGISVTPMSNIVRELINYRKNNINTLSAIIADQVPAKSEIKYWTTFLNQDTPVYMGTEKIAAKYDMAIVFFNVKKIKRGYYHVNIELLHEHTAGLPEHAITEAHVRKLEEIIREKPEYWLWSHRRWKHKRPVKE